MTKHVLSVEDFSLLEIEKLFERARVFERLEGKLPLSDQSLQGQRVALLFAEPSTRTRVSFEIASQKLGAQVVSLGASDSSLVKGESVLDTVNNLFAMGIRFFVIRHKDNGVMATLKKEAPPGCHLINAGEGTHEHPTQALLDVFTMLESNQNPTVAMVGDIVRSRVAQSNLKLLSRYGFSVRIFGPDNLMPTIVPYSNVKKCASFEEALSGADVIMMLRVQNERLTDQYKDMDPKAYLKSFGLTSEKLKWAKPDARIMHPGPFRRDYEIESALVSCPQSVIFNQVENGVFVRMAVLDHLMRGGA